MVQDFQNPTSAAGYYAAAAGGRLLVRIAVAEGSSLIVQRNGPVQIARDAAARLIAFRKGSSVPARRPCSAARV